MKKKWRVSTNTVAWVEAGTKEAAIEEATKIIETTHEMYLDDGSISVEDVYDVSEVEPATSRED